MRAKANEGVRPSVFCIDIDKFKSVNVSFGLVVGDSLLLTVARRLQSHLGPQDTLARVARRSFCHRAGRRACRAGPGGARRTRAPLAACADQDRRPGDRAHRLGRHRRLRRRRGKPPRPLQRGRDRHVPRQARRLRPRRDLSARDARRPRRPRGDRERSAQGARQEPDPRPLPADRLPADRGACGFRGVGALGASQTRSDEPRRLHPRGGGERPDRAPRLACSAQGCPGGRPLAARVAARRGPAVCLRQHLEPTAIPPEPGPGDPPHPRAQYRSEGHAAARDHRKPRDGESRSRRPRSSSGYAAPAPSSPSTISAPATRRLPTCSGSPSTP